MVNEGVIRAMLGRWVLSLAAIGFPLCAAAGEMKPDEARRFVAGKLFAYSCFDGTTGIGRIYNDGSAAGTMQNAGKGAVRYLALPPNTLQVKGQSICASVKGLFFEPCFNLTRTSDKSFRGAISGLGFAYCDFVRRGGRAELARATTRPKLRPALATTETTETSSSGQ